MKSLYFCRHGRTDWNAERRIQGRTDIPLNATGLEQAQKLADFFVREQPEADIVVTSPMSRAYQTAHAVSERLGLDLIVDEDLNEIHTGVFTGMRLDDLRDNALWQAHLQDPWKAGYGENGEDADAVRERMVRVIHRYENAILVSHASPIRHALMYLLDIPHHHLYDIQVHNAAASLVQWHNDHPKLVYINKNS